MCYAVKKAFACSSSDEPDDVFLARPKVIQFTQYTVGIVYEVMLCKIGLGFIVHKQEKLPLKKRMLYYTVAV